MKKGKFIFFNSTGKELWHDFASGNNAQLAAVTEQNITAWKFTFHMEGRKAGIKAKDFKVQREHC
jgi:hypothetical protein